MLILTIIMIIYIIFKYIIALSKKYSKKEFKNKKEHSESDYRFLNEVQKVICKNSVKSDLTFLNLQWLLMGDSCLYNCGRGIFGI